MNRTHKILAAIAVPAAAGALVLGATGIASAATPVSGDGYVGVVLDHNETVVASQINAGNLINLAFGDAWTVGLPDDSIWSTGGGWTPVTGDQLFDEAASHPNGTVGIHLVDPATNLGNIFYAGSGW